MLALAPLMSLLPMVSYWVVSPWWLSLTLRVAVGEVALSVVPWVMPVVRSLRALLWFTASLMLLMLLVVGVGLCVGCQWPACPLSYRRREVVLHRLFALGSILQPLVGIQ